MLTRHNSLTLPKATNQHQEEKTRPVLGLTTGEPSSTPWMARALSWLSGGHCSTATRRNKAKVGSRVPCEVCCPPDLRCQRLVSATAWAPPLPLRGCSEPQQRAGNLTCSLSGQLREQCFYSCHQTPWSTAPAPNGVSTPTAAGQGLHRAFQACDLRGKCNCL